MKRPLDVRELIWLISNLSVIPVEVLHLNHVVLLDTNNITEYLCQVRSPYIIVRENGITVKPIKYQTLFFSEFPILLRQSKPILTLNFSMIYWDTQSYNWPHFLAPSNSEQLVTCTDSPQNYPMKSQIL